MLYGVCVKKISPLIAAVILLLHLDGIHAQSLAPLPQGNTGIASRYPGDSGIIGDEKVIFADDFENYNDADELEGNWNGGVYHHVELVEENDGLFGKKSLKFHSSRQTRELSNTVAKQLFGQERRDTLFFRYYSKFEQTFDIVGSSHNGGGISAGYYENGRATPGIPADGHNKFLAEFEFWRSDSSEPSPGKANVYVYHPGQRTQWGDHWFPDGTVSPWTYLPGEFGEEFVSRPNVVCSLGTWHCYELMVQANTPGQHNGRIACWLDGQLIADFPNLRLRDTDSLKIDRFNLSLHSGSNPNSETGKWYDNVVAATSYIGPRTQATSLSLNTKDDSHKPVRPAINSNKATFALSRRSTVTLQVFDARGKLISLKKPGIMHPGTHSLSLFDPITKDLKANGVYIVHLTAGDNLYIQKITLHR